MKTHELMGKRVGVFGTRALGAALLAAACGGSVTKGPSVGSESHFLGGCELGCGRGLDCIGGICTRACLTERASCTDLAPAAQCTNQSVEPGEVAVCDVACRGTLDCEGLGDGYACSAGFCRLMLDRYCSDGPCPSGGSGGGMSSGPATGGTSSGGAGGGSGGASEPSSDCELFRDQVPPPDVRTLSITNTGSVALYILPFTLGCRLPSSLVQVQRQVPGGEETLNVLGIDECEARSCEQLLDQGWAPLEPCNTSCAIPHPVQILPGQTREQPLGREVVVRDVPSACVAGLESPTERCSQRVIPPPGEYTFSIQAVTALRCNEGVDCECRPDENGVCALDVLSLREPTSADVAFGSEGRSFYYQSQEMTIEYPTTL